MCKKVIIGALLGGVVLLLWQFAVRELLGIYDDAFGAVNRDGRHGFGAMLGVQFAVNVLASALLMFVLLAANPPTLGSRLALVLCFAVFAVLTELIPNWNWGGSSLAYIGRQIGEQIVGWALVGLVLAKVMDKCKACCGSDGADATPDA